MTKQGIRRVARRTVEALREGDYQCCLFGSAACALWGVGDPDRVPGDVDIVVFTNDHRDQVKEFLTSVNHRFVLVNGRHGDYKVLYYVLSRQPRLRCKVEILTAGEDPMGIPPIPPERISYMLDIPVMPLFPILILHVQGLREHSLTRKHWLRKKIPQDIKDIEEMLNILKNARGVMKQSAWLPYWFKSNARRLVEEYVL